MALAIAIGLDIGIGGGLISPAADATAQSMAPESIATRYILDSGMLVLGGITALILTIAFAFRDAGLSRDSSAIEPALRLSGILAAGGIMFWATGYHLIFSVEPGGLLGEFAPYRANDADPISTGYASAAHWLYYFGLATISTAIVSSAIAERTRLAVFVIFAGAFIGLIFPIALSWVYAGGFLISEWRFHDAGTASVHIIGGAAALAAVIIIGPRDGGATAFHNTSSALPVAAFSTAIMLMSLFVVTAAAQPASSIDAAINISNAVVNQLLAACAGAAFALFLTRLVYKRTGLIFSLAGAVGGAVALSADPIQPASWQALMIGAMSGVIVTVLSPFLRRFQIDDAGVVIAAHFFCGIWGVLIAPWHSPEVSFLGQAMGAAMLTSFAFFMSLCLWTALRFSIGVRVTKPPKG